MTKTAQSAQKKSIFPPIFAWNNWFSQETQAIWKKLKQLLGKTQENIQKLKQNEHQVLSCSQKKCKIKTPGPLVRLDDLCKYFKGKRLLDLEFFLELWGFILSFGIFPGVLDFSLHFFRESQSINGVLINSSFFLLI